MNKPRIRISWFPKHNRGVIDCLFRLRGRDDIHVSFDEESRFSAVSSLDLGKRLEGLVCNAIDMMLNNGQYWEWPCVTESIVVELKVGE